MNLGYSSCKQKGMFRPLSLTSLLGGRSVWGSEDVTRKEGQRCVRDQAGPRGQIFDI